MLARRHDPSAPTDDLDDSGHSDDEALAVRDALRVLSPRQRAAVVLRYFEDLKEAEIAAALGCRPGTVKSLLSRSMSKLKGVPTPAGGRSPARRSTRCLAGPTTWHRCRHRPLDRGPAFF